MTKQVIAIAAQPPAMDSERVLDLLGKPFEGDYVSGAAEWLKNALDHALRTDEPGEPVIVIHVTTPRGLKEQWMMECVDFLGTTYEEIDEHLKRWGSEIAASRGRAEWAGFGGHGNGGKFHMRQNFRTSEFITYRYGKLTVFGFNDRHQYGFDDRYKGTEVAPDDAPKIAGMDVESLPVQEAIKQRLRSGDPDQCRFTIVRGRGFSHAQRWRKRENFDDKLRADPQAKQVLNRARVIYWSDSETVDPLKPPEIQAREGYEDGREYEMPRELELDGDRYEIAKSEPAGLLVLDVAEEPFRRFDASHAIDIKGRHGLTIASYRVTELPIRNRAGADFIYGELDCPAVDDLGLRQNNRQKLVPNDITDAILIWLAERIDELSNELAEAENKDRQRRDVEATLALTNRLNRWKNRFLRSREIFVNIGTEEGTGFGGTGGGGTAGPGPIHGGDGAGGSNGGTGGSGEGGAGTEGGGGGSGEETKKAPRFPEILVSGFDPDPDTGERFSLHPRQPVVYQRHNDVDRNLWWINAQRPLAERILNEDRAESARWRDYVFNRFCEVIQAYEVRERWDGTTDIAEFNWELLGQVHDSAAGELSDVLFEDDIASDAASPAGSGSAADGENAATPASEVSTPNA
jgi:hypothetical protein